MKCALLIHLLLLTVCLNVSAAERIFSEGLTGDSIPASMEAWSGSFLASTEGVYPGDNKESLLFPVGMPEVDICTVSVTVTPHEEMAGVSWPMVGLTIYRDNGNHWIFTLTGSPERRRYFQLIERQSGVHQAQSTAGYKLPDLSDFSSVEWKLDYSYHLALKLTPTQILATATDLQTGEKVFERSFGLPTEVAAVRSGLPGIFISGLDAKLKDFAIDGAPNDKPNTLSNPNRDLVTIIDQPQARLFTAALATSLQVRGINPVYLSPEALTDRRALTRTGAGTVILPWAPGYPTNGTEALTAYLRGGGSLLAVGGVLSTEAIKEAEANLKAREEALATTEATGKALDFETIDSGMVGKGVRDGEVDYSMADTEAGYVLHVTMPKFSDWVNISSPAKPLPEDNLLTLFQAKGGPNTKNMIVEYAETDGSRWIATITLTPEWKRYALLPRHFVYWPDNPSKGRGFAGDRVNLTRVSRISVGLSSIGCNIPAGSHEFWVGNINYGPVTEDIKALNWTPPIIECLSPDYKVYTSENVNNFKVTAAEQKIFKLNTALPRMDVISPIARSKGAGYYPAVQRRWVPLVEGRSRDGGEATLASLFFPQAGFLSRARWATLGVANLDDLNRHADALAEFADNIVQRLNIPVRLMRGGLNQACLIHNADGVITGFDAIPQIGVEVNNEGLGNARVEAQITAVTDDGNETELGLLRLKVAPGETASAEMTELPGLAKLPVGQHHLIIALRVQGVVVDRIIQDFSIINPPSATRDEMVQTQDGQFVLNGKRWYAQGINFWPRYVSGTDPDEYWGHWLTPQFYMPDEVEEDLRIAHDMGLNALLIGYWDPKQVAPLNDFLARCRKYDIKAYVSVSGMNPFTGDMSTTAKMIKAARLPDNPAVFGYDLAWEPHWGAYADRLAHRARWERWVVQQYGSLENAQQQWKFDIPRTAEGGIDIPGDVQIRTDGEWHYMACAYSRFLDDYLGRAWMEEAAAIRLMDPNHLLSFRAAGQPSWQGWGSYDMIAAGPFMDFLGPEGYGQDPKEAGFTTSYARWAGNGKPVWWAEFGATIGRYPTPELVETQRELWRGFSQMALDSEANGDAGWWFSGGYRVNELSDFGIIAQQGTLRPAAQVRKSFTKRFETAKPRKQRETVVIDRDLHATNYHGVYEAGKQTWVEANARGRGLDLVTEATGTTSATVPLRRLGNAEFDIDGPPKYLTGLFRSLELRAGEGEWVAVKDGDTLKVTPGHQILVRATLVNTGEPQWLAGLETGCVVLAAGQHDGLSFQAPFAENIARYGDGSIVETVLTEGLTDNTTVTFGLHCLGRAWFGERVEVKLEILK